MCLFFLAHKNWNRYVNNKTKFGLFKEGLSISSILLLGLALVLTVIILSMEFNVLTATEDLQNNDKKYFDNFIYLWLITYVLYASCFFLVARALPPNKKILEFQIGIAVTFIVLAVFITVAWLIRTGENITGGAATAAIGMLTFASASLALFMSTKSKHQSERTNHSLKILLDSRLSEVYQSNIVAMQSVYPRGTKINNDDVDLYFQAVRRPYLDLKREHDEEIANAKSQKLEQPITLLDKKLAIDGAQYLLNFYEFCAAGIHNGDLDDDFLYEQARGFVDKLWDKCEHLIISSRVGLDSQTKVWKQFESLVLVWKDRYEKEKAAMRAFNR